MKELPAIGVVVLMLAFSALYALWRGLVLTVLWAWFVVPIFGAPALSIASALGVSHMV